MDEGCHCCSVQLQEYTTNLASCSAVFNTQFIHTCLFAEVDGYVGDGQRHQESDERPVVRERREFHHDRLEESGSTANISCSGLEGCEGRSQPVEFWVFSSRNPPRSGPSLPSYTTQHHKQWSGAWENRRVTRNFCWRLLHCSTISREEK